MTSEVRPHPDRLLQAIAAETKQPARGRLRIFLGACAGVGKTYAMLEAARQRQTQGIAVGIGIVETHGRNETHALTEGLPQLALRHVVYQGHTLREFDLDGALAARPALILVDELAHANAPGSRHARRWQDIDELLRAGLDVYTTLNIQQLESLNDVVGGITGVRVRETIPDRIFDDADDVVLIDIPSEDLLTRLKTGKIYLPATAEYASSNFFREGNLVALRELALRRLADRVDMDLRRYRTRHAIDGVWPTHERLLICVRAEPSHERLIREGARLAQRLQADWVVIHVDDPRGGRDPAGREMLLRLVKLAESLGAEFANIPGEDVSQTLLDYARARNATRLVLGHGRRHWQPPWRKRLADRIADTHPELGVVLIHTAAAQAPPGEQRPKTLTGPHVTALILAALACGLTTAVAALLLRVFDLSNVVMLFLLTVVLVALRWGRAAGALAALLSVASFDFFFVPPVWSFHVSDTQYIFTFVLMLIVALVTGQLAARLRAEATTATAGERRATALARVARDLSAAIRPAQIHTVCTETIAPLFACRGALLLPDATERIGEGQPDFVDTSVAQWVYEHVQPAGLGTPTLAGAGALYLPLKAPLRTRGVLALQPQGLGPSDPDDRRLLDACCALIALALERIHFVDVAKDTLVRMEGERLRNALLAAVSHDLKTPLTAISGLAETLETTGGLPESQRNELARAIRHQSEQLHRLVTNLLDLARMQSNGVRLDRQWHSLDEIVGSALAGMGTTPGQRHLHTELAAELPLIELDASLFERVLFNLLDNAVKYTPPQATIWIRAAVLSDTMHLWVDDDGPGLPVDTNPETLFEPFTRGVRESPIPGVGLGLALCRSIVAAHGGTIAAAQRQPHGARFEIQLPLGSPPTVESESAI